MSSAVSYQVGVKLLGSSFVLDTTDPITVANVRRLWLPFVEGESDVTARLVAGAGTTPSARLAHFAVSVNASALDAAADLAIHAGVVAHDGVAIAMPATSGTGKSTMTAACLRRGFRYVSDEALCLDYSDGSVVPYPRPIALSAWSVGAVGARATGTPAGDELLFTAEDLGSCRHAGPARLGHVVVLDRRATGRPSLSPEPRPTGVTLLLQLSFNHYRRPADAVRLAADVISDAEVWTLRYSDPLDAADLLWSSLAQPTTRPGPIESRASS